MAVVDEILQLVLAQLAQDVDAVQIVCADELLNGRLLLRRAAAHEKQRAGPLDLGHGLHQLVIGALERTAGGGNDPPAVPCQQVPEALRQLFHVRVGTVGQAAQVLVDQGFFL